VLFDTIYINCFGFGFRRILVYPYGNGNDTNNMSIYLDTMQSPNSYQGGTRDVTFRLVVFNQFDSTMSIKKRTIPPLSLPNSFYSLAFKVKIMSLNGIHLHCKSFFFFFLAYTLSVCKSIRVH
jgi:hypothetical protein